MDQGPGTVPATPGAGGLDRRRFIRRTAVAGGAVWAVPTLLTVNRAAAVDLTSAPPASEAPSDEVLGDDDTQIDDTPAPEVEGDAGPGPGGGDELGVGGGSETAGGQAGGTTNTGGRNTLPRTGSDTDKLVATGLAAVAGGAALTAWSADRQLVTDSGIGSPAEPEA